jgi:glycogen debranching enzyme
VLRPEQVPSHPPPPAALPRPGRLPPGQPEPLGASVQAGGLNLALWAPEASAVWLCLFSADGQVEQQRLALTACHDGVWHGHLAGGGPGLVYGWRVAGRWAPDEGLWFNPQRVLLDPQAQAVVGRYGGDLDAYLAHDPHDPARPHPQDNARLALKARVPAPLPPLPPLAPRIEATQRVIAEVHVKAVSMRHPDIPEALRGSYAALAHPALIEHWRRLGVTTLELLPVQCKADEARLQRQGLHNHWGYSSIGYLAPEPAYWSGRPGTDPASELREAIAALHAAGFEVLLDVVFNHTAETDEQGPCLSFRGIGNRQYYRLDPARPRGYLNWSGCGNSLNLAEPQVLRWVLDALRHWALAYGVDGFRFDLASSLGRDAAGAFSAGSAFFGALQADPVLRERLWVAEPWDLGPGGYQPGHFPPGWLEWNDQARDALRAYWLRPGDPRATRAELAQRLAGSSARFRLDPRQPRSPLASVNFVTAHDGFTLRDLVSYDQRHNQANGEHNRDGHHDNLSWNAGVEGPSDDPAVQATRAALQRALLATLLLARGTPMLLAGDEIGHSQQGNNNAYCQDNHLTWLAWDTADLALARFAARVVALRRGCPALHDAHWLHGRPGDDGLADVAWAGPDGQALSVADWHDTRQRGLQVRLAAPGGGPECLLLFNPGDQPLHCQWPAPQRGPAWWPWLDSHQADGCPATTAPQPGGAGWLAARSLQLWGSQAAAPLPPGRPPP